MMYWCGVMPVARLKPRPKRNRSRPTAAAMSAQVSFAEVDLEALYEAAFRLDGLYWKSKTLAVQVVLR